MYRLLMLGLLLSGLPLDGGGLNRVHTANQLAARASAAFAHGRDGAAIAAYEQLAELGPLPEEARLNLGHAYFRAGRRAQARSTYSALTSSANLPRRAVALHQLGLLAAAERDYDRAQRLLRTALRADPTSGAIRTSYETLARWLASDPASDDQPPGGFGDSKQPRPSQSGEERPSEAQPDGPGTAPRGTGEQAGGGDRPDATGDRSESVKQGGGGGNQRGFGNQSDGGAGGPAGRPTGGNTAADATTSRAQTRRALQPDATIPAAQARMLLEAMQAAETQYLQQLRRPTRPAADPSKPDW